MKKTKKLLAFLLALAMCAFLIACGGSDDGGAESEPVEESVDDEETYDDSTSEDSDSEGPADEQIEALTEAYQEAYTVYTEAVETAQENGWDADEQTVSDFNMISAGLDPIGQALNGDMSLLEGADFDDLILAVQEAQDASQTLLDKVSGPYDGGDSASDDTGEGAGDEAVVTDEALKPLANAYNEVANIYNEVYTAAEANGWLEDEQTAAELDAVYGMVTFVGSGLSDDPSKLEDVDLDGLTEQLTQIGPELEKIGERVSVPYGN